MGCTDSKAAGVADGSAPAARAAPAAAAAAAGGAAPKASPTKKEDKPSAAASQPAKGLSPEVRTEKFDQLEKEVTTLMKDESKVTDLWKRLDFNGNGKVSLAEIDKFTKEKYPLLDHKPALMRAYKQTTLRDGDGDAWVEKKEFKALIRNLFYFNRLFYAFDAIDKDDDRRVDLAEFQTGVNKVGLKLTPAEAKKAFEEIDVNKGGFILFDEFCTWIANKKCPVD